MGEGGVATVLLFPHTSPNPSSSVNQVEVYRAVTVNILRRGRRQRHH